MIFPEAEEALLTQGDDNEGEKRQKAPLQSDVGLILVAFYTTGELVLAGRFFVPFFASCA